MNNRKCPCELLECQGETIIELVNYIKRLELELEIEKIPKKKGKRILMYPVKTSERKMSH